MQKEPRKLCWSFTKVLAIALLATSAYLKTKQLFSNPSLPRDILEHRSIQFLAIELEIALIFWAAWGKAANLLRVTLTCTFLVFGVISFYRYLSGYADCGCFGATQIHPAVTAALDFLIASLLTLSQPYESTRAQLPPWLALPAFITTAILVAVTVASSAPKMTEQPGVLLGGSSSIILEPKSWQGGGFPISSYLPRSGGELLTGQWLVLFVRHDCHKCTAVLRQQGPPPDSEKVAIIEVPPFGSTPKTRPEWLHLQLSDSITWHVEVPCRVSLKDGVVVSTSQ